MNTLEALKILDTISRELKMTAKDHELRKAAVTTLYTELTKPSCTCEENEMCSDCPE